MKKILFSFFFSFLILLNCSTNVFATEPVYDDYVEIPIFNIIDNDINLYKELLKTNLNILNGGCSVGEGVNHIVNSFGDTAVNNFCEMFGVSDINSLKDLTESEFAKTVTNYIRQKLQSGGGHVQNFPASANTIYLEDGTYFVVRPRGDYPDSPRNEWNRLAIDIYHPDGTFETYNYAPSFKSCNPIIQKHEIVTLSNGQKWLDIYVQDSIDLNYVVKYSFQVGCDLGPQEQTTVDNLSDEDLLTYLEIMVDTLQNTYPDTSTIEGLLQSILNDLNKLQGGFDCPDLLDKINNSIITLNSDENLKHSEILSALFDIKAALDTNNPDSIDYSADISDIKLLLQQNNEYLSCLVGLSDSNMDEDTKKEEEDKANLRWLTISSVFKRQFGFESLEQSISNFQSSFFSERTFSTDSDGCLVYSINSSDPSAASLTRSPSLKFTVFNTDCDLFQFFGYLNGNGAIDVFKQVISVFLNVAFVISLFRSIPAMLMDVEQISKL